MIEYIPKKPSSQPRDVTFVKKVLLLLVISLTLLTGCLQGEPVPIRVISPPYPQPEMPGAVVAMIDNHLDAFPQSGLHQADIVYEILAEGGITRFMALYYWQKPEKIGPVRSSRYYFAQIAKAYNAPYAHAGGHETALQMIKDMRMLDVDEINNSSAYFYRDKTRHMPHNLYTSGELLEQWGSDRKITWSPLPDFSTGPLPAGGTAADWLEINYDATRTYIYRIGYEFKDGSYQRIRNGETHLSDDQPIKAGAVTVILTPARSVVKGKPISEIDIVGSGQALFFRNGKVFEGQWRKSTPSSHMELLYQGEPMPVVQGPHWIQAVTELSRLSYGKR